MTKLILAPLIAVTLVAGASRIGRAQEQSASRPDFSGKWAVDWQASSPGLLPDGVLEGRRFPRKPRPTPGGPPTFAPAFTAHQDESALTVEMKVGVVNKDTTVVYKLDGSDSLNLEGMAKTVSTATWQHGTLMILTHVTEINGKGVGADLVHATRSERVMSLDASGRLLIDTTVGVDPTYLTVYRRVN
jgi:hypothetical protein